VISDISIKRPVLTSMVAAALVLFGAISLTRLSVRELPDVDPPVVSVSTFLRGANPRVIETTVTDVLEEELSTIPGIRTLTSSSAEQSSNITLEFTLDRRIEDAAQDVRDKVSRVRGRQKALAEIERRFVEATTDGPGLRVAIAHADAAEWVGTLSEVVWRVRPKAEIEFTATLGAVVGTHAGPGAVGFFWFQDE